MQVTVKLQEPFSFSIIPILVLFCLLSVSAYLYIKKKKRKTINDETPEVKEVDERSIIKYQKKYIKQLQILQTKVNNKKISNRRAYQRLSKIIRYFVHEVTGINVHNYTLVEIKKLKMNKLTELIEEYYVYEFSNMKTGNINESIDKTRKVIVRWK